MRLPPGTATVTALLSSATDAMWKATVAATGKDQLRLNEDVELRPSFGKGMGVFAMRCARTHTSVCSCAAFRVRVPLSVPHSAPHPVLTACIPRAYHMPDICSPEPGTPGPTPHTQHPLAGTSRSRRWWRGTRASCTPCRSSRRRSSRTPRVETTPLGCPLLGSQVGSPRY